MAGSTRSGNQEWYGELSDKGRRLVAEVAAQFGQHLDAAQAAINSRVAAEVPELGRGPVELRDVLDRSTAAHMALLRGVLGAWADPRVATAPPESIEWAVELARHGFPIETLLRAYRIGHAEFSQFWLKLLSARVTDPDLLAETSAATSAYLFSYVESVLAPTIEHYLAERERIARHSQSLRDAELRRVLRGEQIDVRVASDRLRYRLDTWHIGFIAWSDADDADSMLLLDQAGSRIAESFDATQTLLVPASRSVVHGWVGSWSALDAEKCPEIEGLHVCMGKQAKGLSGFRRTHEQAGLARRVARLYSTTPAFLAYRDCAVTALLSSDVDQAHQFMIDVLGPTLDRDDAQALLQTVSIYQQECLSLSRAADRLHMHRNTVSYRVRRVVEASTENDAGSLPMRAAVELALLFAPGRGAERGRGG
jgi:DNA-binding PucR family transcriptional regulator